MADSLLSAPRVGKLAKLRVPLAFALALPLFLYLTFPFEELSRRLETEARKNGLELAIGSLGSSGLLGVKALDVKARAAQQGSGPALELAADKIALSPEVLGLLLRRIGFTFDVDAYGGTAQGRARVSNNPKLPGLAALLLDARDLDLKSLPLGTLANLEAIGRLALKANLPELQPIEAASGSASLALKGGALLKGQLALGPGMNFPLPKLVLGEVEGSVTIDKGLAKIEKLTARGGDVEADVDGTIRLKPLLAVSEANLRVRLKPSDKWLDSNPMIKGSLGFLGPKQADGYWVTLSGPLTRMNPRPGR